MLPSVKVPVAVNCWVRSKGTDGFAGVTAIDARGALPTVNVAEAEIEPEVTVIFVVPAPELVANP